MKIISPKVEILTPLDGQAVLQHIERCVRVCYKSEDKITDTSAAPSTVVNQYGANNTNIANAGTITINL